MCLEISSPAENVARFVSFCAANNLAIVLTMFPPKNIHKYTWTAPNGRVRDQVDHVAVISKFQRSVKRSDNVRVITTARLRLCGIVKIDMTQPNQKYWKLSSSFRSS